MSQVEDWSDHRVATGRYLGDSVAVAALLLDRDHRVLRFNRAFSRMAGNGPSPLGRPLPDLLEPGSRPTAERLLHGKALVERLQFLGEGRSIFEVTCRVYSEDQGLLLLGDQLTLTEGDVLQTMSRINGEVVNLGRELERKNRALQRALEDVKTLQGILTVCMHCKQIRGEAGAWQRLEVYISEHSDAEFSHGLCEACAALHYPETFEPKP